MEKKWKQIKNCGINATSRSLQMKLYKEVNKERKYRKKDRNKIKIDHQHHLLSIKIFNLKLS